MSLEVRFDGTLIDEQYYTGLTNNNELFNESFRLGATPCNQYVLRIAKEGVSTQPSTITLADNGTTFASLDIDNIEEQDYEYVYTLTDKMINLEFYYDASEIFSGGSTTLLLIAQDICTKAGLTLGTVNFRGYNKSINWYDNTRTAREYIGYIAELNGGFARIEGTTLYFVKQKTNSASTIDIDDCEDFNIGEQHIITRVVYELGELKYEFGNDTGNTLYLNGENVFITEESEVEGIYNDIQGFEFYSFTSKNCPVDYNVKVGDVITFTDGTNNYPTIAQYDLEYYGDWIGGYSLSVNTEKQEETKVVGNKENIRNIRILVDRQNGIIEDTVEEVGEQNNKISQITQTVDELNTKIQDIADITVNAESTQARVELENINESEPISINVHPIGTNISYLYPHEGLYPSDTLYLPNRVLRFIRTYEEEGTTKTENIDYELPDDLLYYDSENYDEFILNYDSQTCQVRKKCKYNADGTVGLLANEVTTDYPYPQILLGDGDYEVKLLGYNVGYLAVRLMATNIYTSQFATKVEMRSEISQTATQIQTTVSETYETKGNAQTNYSQLTQTATSLQSQINSNDTDISTINQTIDSVEVEVGKKYNTSDFTNAKITAKINDGTSSVQIDASKISLVGKQINLTGDNTTITSTNFSVDKDGNMSCRGGNFTNGSVNLTSDNGNSPSALSNFKITKNGRYVTLKEYYNSIRLQNDTANVSALIMVGDAASGVSSSVDMYGNNQWISMSASDDGNAQLSVGYNSGHINDHTHILATGIETPTLKCSGIYNLTTTSSPNLWINAYGTIYRSTNTSSQRYKKDIQDLTNKELDPHNLYNLKVKQFKYKTDYLNNKNDCRYEKDLIGFIAEDVEKIYPIAVDYIIDKDNNKLIDNWNEKYMIPAMLKLIQEQHSDIQKLQKEIQELKGEK